MNLQENHSLKHFNSFGIEVTSRYFSHLQSTVDINDVLEWRQQSELPLLLLGGGSNVLFKGNYSGMSAVVMTKGIEVIGEDDDYTYIKAAAGENWHQFVRWTVENGYAGLENLSLIPGTVGAAPMQNIGAYGVELADHFHELEAIALSNGEMSLFDKDSCHFDYRDSYFKSEAFGEYLINAITVKLPKQPQWKIDYAGVKDTLEDQSLNAQSISDAIIALRQSKLPDPAEIGNAGSFFKNPILNAKVWQKIKQQHPTLPGYPQKDSTVKSSAAWLIDQCGWKGKRQGDAGIYQQHALVLVNHGKATGEQLWALAEDIIHSVEDRFAITLEVEPRVIDG